MIGILDWEIRAAGTTLTATGGNINIDDQNVPAITASVVVPHDQTFFDALDPRQTPVPRVIVNGTLTEWASRNVGEVSAYFLANSATTVAGVSSLWSGMNIGDVTQLFGKPLHALAPNAPRRMTLDLHVREIDTDGFEMTITLASDEALLMDWSPTSGEDLLPLFDAQAGMSPRWVSTYVGPVLQTVLGVDLTPGPYDTTSLSYVSTPAEILDWSGFPSAWDMMRPALEDTDLKLRCNPTGRGFSLQRPVNSIRNPADHAFLLTSQEVTTVRHVYSRSGDWYDSAILNNSDGTVGWGYPVAGTLHSRTYREEMPEGIKPSVSMAENITRRSVNRGKFIDITAPIQPIVFMRDEFAYVENIGDPDPEQWITKSVSYDITSGLMNIRGEERY